MNNIARIFQEVYMPFKALVVYQSLLDDEKNIYVEAYDMDENGSPVNAHPLSMEEAAALADSLDSSPEMQRTFLKPKGLLPENVLYINPDKNSFVIWYTAPQEVNLFFTDNLSISCGKANIPALVWKASKDSLGIYALKDNKKPSLKTALYHAPFFNIYKDGRVCMGTVDIEITNTTMLEDFIKDWQEYFFNSYFSHLLDDYCPVSANIIQLWQRHVNSNKKFPADVLVKNIKTLKDLIQ